MIKHTTMIKRAVERAGGPSVVARASGLRPQSIRDWWINGLPKSDFFIDDFPEKTNHAELLQKLTGGKFTAAQLKASRLLELRKS